MSSAKQFPASRARVGLDVLHPSTGCFVRVESVEHRDGQVQIRHSQIPGQTGFRVPEDRVLIFKRGIH